MTMPFGKFRGFEMADLPDDYLDWLITIDLRDRLRDAVMDERARRRWSSSRRDPWREAWDESFTRSCAIEIAPEDVQLVCQIVTEGYRSIAKKSHPDVGGDVRTMQRLNAVTESLRRQIGAIA